MVLYIIGVSVLFIIQYDRHGELLRKVDDENSIVTEFLIEFLGRDPLL